MSGEPWLWLYRATAPTARAQAIQALHSAHAVARRGVRVTLAVNPAHPGVTATDVLAWYGLEPEPCLDLRVLPFGGTPASLAFRVLVATWLLRHPTGVVYARDQRYARALLRVAPWARLYVEVHEVDSVQAAARGDDPRPWRATESAVLARARGVVANAPGTLDVLARAHPGLPRAIVAHNGTRAAAPPIAEDRARLREGAAYVGSVHPDKDLDTLARAAAVEPLTLVGGQGPAAERLVALSGGRLTVRPPVPHREVPALLARQEVLVLTLGPGLFGEQLASPLKLWDYLASGRPVVAADLPAIHAAAPGRFVPYTPGDPDSLVGAIRRARAAGATAPRPRTWDDRAAELVAFVGAA